MARKRGQLPFIEGLEITTLAAEGKAMGHYDGMVVFVPMTVPGDVVDVQIKAKKRRFMLKKSKISIDLGGNVW